MDGDETHTFVIDIVYNDSNIGTGIKVDTNFSVSSVLLFTTPLGLTPSFIAMGYLFLA